MCLAILKPAKVSIPEAHIRQGWISNSDGGGYAFIDKKKMIIRKGIMTLKEFNEAYQKDSKQYKKSPFVVHFRIRSTGDKSAENTHPFIISDGVLAHNGTLDGTGAEYGKGPNDTAKFCNLFGEKFTFNWVKENKDKLGEAIGRWNKLVMLYTNGQYQIVNESEGVWSDDVWYSNHTFKPRPAGSPGHYGMMEDYE